LAYAFSLTIWTQMLIKFGLQVVGARWIAIRPNRTLHIMARVLRFRLLVALLFAACVCMLAFLSISDERLRSVLLARTSVMIADAFIIGYVYIGLNRPISSGFNKSLAQVAYLLGIILFVDAATPLFAVPLINGLALLLVRAGFMMWLVVMLPRSVPQPRDDFDVSNRMIWAEGFPIMISTCLQQGYPQLGVLALGLVAEKTVVGAYGAAVRIFLFSLFLADALTRTFGPRLAAVSEEGDRREFRDTHRKLVWMAWALGLAGFIGIGILAAPAVTMVLGESYELSWRGFRWLGIAFMVEAAQTPFYAILPYVGVRGAFVRASALGVIAHIVALVILVPELSYVGAALSSAVGSAVRAAYSLIVFRKWRDGHQWNDVRP
jgi:O-antigen/teichoic acid export membrane protein